MLIVPKYYTINLEMPTIVLVNPEIPQNTGNIIRLCANMGAKLCLVKPLGFDLDNKKLQRAHLYYDEFTSFSVFENWNHFYEQYKNKRILAIETGGNKTVFDVKYNNDDVLVFGSESSGLSSNIIDSIGTNNLLSIPMLPKSRSLNLANCASIVLYETWRQNDFKGSVNHFLNFNYSF